MEQTLLLHVNAEQLKMIVHEAVADAIATPKKAQEAYLTREDITKKFHVCLATVHVWVNTGKLKAYRIGHRTFFKASEVESAIGEYKTLKYVRSKEGGRK